MPTSRTELPRVDNRWAVALTTFRRDATPVTTAVNLALDGEKAYFRTYDQSGKAKCLRDGAIVEVAPSDWRGTPTAPAFTAKTRPLDGEEADHAAQLIDAKHPWFHRLLVRLGRRLQGYKTLHYELLPLSSIID